MDRKFVKTPRRFQEDQQIVAQHISHLRDEINVLVQESMIRYIPINCSYVPESQGRKQGRSEEIIAGYEFLERKYK